MRADVEECRERAIASLRRCCSPEGVRASAGREGHRQVWARDAMIALLGGVHAGDALIEAALIESVRLLGRYAAPTGCIPNNVDPESRRANFRAYADGGLWWVIGSSMIDPDRTMIRRVLDWYECQDVDQSGLISMQESADWQDLFCTRGKGLYLNCLYVLALKKAAAVLGDARCTERARRAAERINEWFWYAGDGNMLPAVAHTFSTETAAARDSLGRKRWLPVKQLLTRERYYLPYLSFRTPGEWFDMLAHCLAVLAGVATGERAAAAMDFVEHYGLAAHPARSLYPVVEPGAPDWREYYGVLNVPHHYHNGGIWPFIGGFYVAALVACGRLEDAGRALERLAALNDAGGFNEWHHGATGEPMGVADQAWSAGMYLYACECVRRGAQV